MAKMKCPFLSPFPSTSNTFGFNSMKKNNLLTKFPLTPVAPELDHFCVLIVGLALAALPQRQSHPITFCTMLCLLSVNKDFVLLILSCSLKRHRYLFCSLFYFLWYCVCLEWLFEFDFVCFFKPLLILIA